MFIEERTKDQRNGYDGRDDRYIVSDLIGDLGAPALVDQEGQNQCNEQHRDRGHEPDLEGVAHCLTEDGIGEDVCEIAEPYERHWADAIPFLEGKVERKECRYKPEDEEKNKEWRNGEICGQI